MDEDSHQSRMHTVHAPDRVKNMNANLVIVWLVVWLFILPVTQAGEESEQVDNETVVTFHCLPLLEREIKGVSKDRGGKFQPLQYVWLVFTNKQQEIRLLWSTPQNSVPIELKPDQYYTFELGITVNNDQFVHYIRKLTNGREVILENWIPTMSVMNLRQEETTKGVKKKSEGTKKAEQASE